VNCLYIAAHWPLPSFSAAGRRTWDILNALKLSLGADIHIACHADISTQWQLWAQSREVSYQVIELNRGSFDDWIKALTPDCVIFDRFLTEEQYGWRVERHLPNAIRVLDMQDWHSLRYARADALKQSIATVQDGSLKPKGILEANGKLLKSQGLNSDVDVTSASVFQRELASMLRSDLVLVISEEECQLMQGCLNQLEIDTRLYPTQEPLSKPNEIATKVCARLAYFPFVHQTSSPVASEGFQLRQHCVFVGNFLHEPNVDAVRWLRERIWPKVHQVLPEVECHIYGAFTGTKVQQLHRPALGFWVKGVLHEEAKTALNRYRINLAPLRFGAGLKGKVFDAALWGTPTVMTQIAAEGLFEEDTLGVVALDEASDSRLAQAIIQFYQSQQDWGLIRGQQQTRILAGFKQSVWNPRLTKALQQVQQTPAAESFLQKMMNKQGHRANAFFSRWIELKETQSHLRQK
jgi:hypothetical protein